MPRSPPPWLDQAAAMLAGGATKADVARAVGVRRETISRQFSRLKPEVERLAAAAATEPADLVARAAAVMQGHMDGQDPKLQLDAAKAVLSRIAPQLPPEPPPGAEEEASPEAAVKELVAALATVGIVVREGVSPELADELRRALMVALDDLRPALAAAAN